MEPKDQLEKFVKDQLEYYEERPSANLWERIEQAIPVRVKTRQRVWIYGIVLGLFPVLGFLGWHLYLISRWESRFAEQEVAIHQLQQEVQQLQQIPVKKLQAKSDSASLTLSKNYTGEQNRLRKGIAPALAASVPVAIPTLKPSPGQEENVFTETPSFTSLESPISITGPSFLDKKPFIIAAAPAALPSIVQPLGSKLRPLSLQVSVDNPKKRWSIGIWQEATNFHNNPLNAFRSRRSNRESAQGSEPTFYINNPSGARVGGLFTEFHLNRRWSLRAGIGYKDYRRPLGGDLVFSYTLDNSQMNALGHSVRPYSYYDESNNISISTVIANALSDQQGGPEPGELFQMDFNAYQQTLYVSFPVWLSYQMGKNRLKYHMRAGLIWNGRLQSSSKIRYLAFSFSQLYYQGHAINDGSVQVGYLDAGLSMGLNYPLNRRFNLSLDGLMYKSVTPVFDQQPFSLGFGGSVRYQL